MVNLEKNIQSIQNSYRVQARVNLDAIRHNLQEVKNKIQDNVMLMAIIKADGYGHGAVPIAKAIGDNTIVDAYGVAIIEEAVDLRQAGITKPVLVLGYTPRELYEYVVAYDISQTVFQYDMAKALSEEACRQNKTVKIHIKFETGMNRIGFSDSKDSVDIIKQISVLPNIEIEGLFSHFSCADITDRTYTENQLARFQKFCSWLEQENIFIPIKHIANSAGIIEFPVAYFNMVRCGIVTYGIYPSDMVRQEEVKLIPAMEIKSQVIFVKEVEEGAGISYGATYISSKKMKIATIPIGYADGYSRNLSNCGKVIIHGQYAPIVGRICMDQFMVDVTDIDDVKQGDTVTLLGQDQEASIMAEELAEWSHSFAYELVCTVGKRIPRYYIDTKIN